MKTFGLFLVVGLVVLSINCRAQVYQLQGDSVYKKISRHRAIRIMKDFVYAQINAERKKRGLSELMVDKRLEKSAQSWAFFMPSKIQKNYGVTMKHNINFTKWYRFNRLGAECIASTTNDPVGSWRHSPPHWGILLEKHTKVMGLGYNRRNGVWVYRCLW